MALYEHVLMVRQDATPQQVDALLEQMKAVLEAGGGKVGKTENWGLRTIAYRIRKNRKAHYALVNIDAPWKAVEEMERQLKINEDVLRFLTVKVEALEEGPSAMLQRRERDERRGERGDRDDRRGDRGDRGDRGERRRRDEFGDDAAVEEAN